MSELCRHGNGIVGQPKGSADAPNDHERAAIRALLTLDAQLTIRDAIVLPRPLVKWSFEAPDPASVPAVIARAAQMAMAAPSGPVFVSVPLDDWHHDADSDHTALLTARNLSARPAPPLDLLKTLADRLNSARNLLFVMGNELDTDEGWKAGIELADKCGAGVYLTIEPARISFPTQHPNFLGTLGAPIATVRKQLTGHDLVIVFGAPVFRYHAWSPGSWSAGFSQFACGRSLLGIRSSNRRESAPLSLMTPTPSHMDPLPS